MGLRGFGRIACCGLALIAARAGAGELIGPGVVSAEPQETSAALSASPPALRGALAPALQPLAYFVGAWDCAGRFLRSGAAIASREVFDVTLDGRWLRLRHDDRPPHAFHALELWGYDEHAGRFDAHVFDNFAGARRYASMGWQGGALVWLGDGDTAADRFSFERRGLAAYRVTYARRGADGRWIDVDTLDCRRSSP
ncbi:hypothetical protein MBSD_n0849 [Mizugakiibacter sediminis]|uniref:DUF1579 domain-containing protein n=1 Tax=Mizugakiibacter sediminis TaxID=1475481 RepID=A0A0K8QL25_9GAMM|nr:DUF1579 domain-containing protein [Mizugakiibacter sediminis]GAP65559.1 hypothetical protein MBSD_n0849 [Mizugakiibacter sediminis]